MLVKLDRKENRKVCDARSFDGLSASRGADGQSGEKTVVNTLHSVERQLTTEKKTKRRRTLEDAKFKGRWIERNGKEQCSSFYHAKEKYRWIVGMILFRMREKYWSSDCRGDNV